MALPYPKITKIPDTEPDAVPALWNDTYDEIDENFNNLEKRLEAASETLITPDPKDYFYVILGESGMSSGSDECTCTHDAEDITYNDTTVKDALDSVLYKKIGITSFTCNPSVVEIGSTVDSVTLRWTTSTTPASITLNEEVLDAALTTKTYSDLALSTDVNYLLKVKDSKDGEAQDRCFVSFRNGIYHGVSGSTEVNNALVKGLTKTLTDLRSMTYTDTANEGEYLYFALPKRLGNPIFTVGGFDGGFGLIQEIEFTNDSGYTETYAVYRSDNPGLGTTTVTIS